MADVFDIDSSGYNTHQKEYNHRGGGGWVPVPSETNNVSRKDPRLARRDDDRKQYSPAENVRSHHRQSTESQMYSQMSTNANYQQTASAASQMYPDYNSGYGSSTSYPQYQQSYQQSQNNAGFNQYNHQSNYQASNQGYNSGQQQQQQQHQLGPPGEEYPGSWAPATTSYPAVNLSTHPPNPVPAPRPSTVSSQITNSKTDDLKKEAAVAQEKKQQRATLIKQREEYLRKLSVLRRELNKLKQQKNDLLSEKSPPRDSNRILRENAKLQVEIQNKLKSINNVVDMLSGIIGDDLKASDDDAASSSSDSSPKHSQSKSRSDDDDDDDDANNKKSERHRERNNDDYPHYNYIHYDPELHWCRICDVFPRSAKDFLNHLHSAEHRQVTQEHQLVDTPWHKLPSDSELPSYKGAPVKRIPIKGLQFFISATSWYCKLCDTWIGDLHCASLHLKSKNHSHNYSNFVEQNPHWESNWLKDREKAYTRCKKTDVSSSVSTPADPSHLNEKVKQKKSRKIKEASFLEPPKEKKRKKKSKKRKKADTSDSSSSSSSSDSSSENENDNVKSIRVSMRNKMKMQAQMILNEEIGGKIEALGKLVEERKKVPEEPQGPPQSVVEDNIINQWMTVNTKNEKPMIDTIKGRLKQLQNIERDKSAELAEQQRRRDREREEREIKEKEQKELENRIRENKEREEREREEKAKEKEKERNYRRKRRTESRSPERYNRGRSRSRSIGKRHRGRSPERFGNRYNSPDEKFRHRREYDDDDDEYDDRDSYRNRDKRYSSRSHKLPFIGRMPVFKKRSDGEEREIKKEDYEIRVSKFEQGSSVRAFIPEPGVAHITKLATPPVINPLPPPPPPQISAQNPPPPPKIIPEPPQISESPPPPPMIKNVVTTLEEPPAETHEMETDEAAPPLPPGVPVSEAKPLAKPAGNHLPPDFQQALNIIFPGDPSHADPNMMMQYQYSMGYGMMYPGMQMYNYNTEEDLIPEHALKESTEKSGETEKKGDETGETTDKDDLALLGIDEEDMAAQTI